MAAILVFRHEGWDVATSSWTAATTAGREGVVVCYEWGPDRVSWFDNSVSTARVTLKLTMDQFLGAVKHGGIVDFRPRAD